MTEYIYHISAREAYIILKKAMAEAKVLLPPAVTKQHWLVGRHSPTAWRSVESWYRGIPTHQPDILARLTDLALMSEAEACLARVIAVGKQ